MGRLGLVLMLCTFSIGCLAQESLTTEDLVVVQRAVSQAFGERSNFLRFGLPTHKPSELSELEDRAVLKALKEVGIANVDQLDHEALQSIAAGAKKVTFKTTPADLEKTKAALALLRKGEHFGPALSLDYQDFQLVENTVKDVLKKNNMEYLKLPDTKRVDLIRQTLKKLGIVNADTLSEVTLSWVGDSAVLGNLLQDSTKNSALKDLAKLKKGKAFGVILMLGAAIGFAGSASAHEANDADAMATLSRDSSAGKSAGSFGAFGASGISAVPGGAAVSAGKE